VQHQHFNMARRGNADDAFMRMLIQQEKRGQVFLKDGRLCFAAPAAKVKQLAKRKRADDLPSELDIMCGYDDEEDDVGFLGDQVGMRASASQHHTPAAAAHSQPCLTGCQRRLQPW
jgi:hypothetical protein